MPTVTIEGVYMNSEVKTTTFEGISKTNLYLDIYQKDSTSSDKMVQLKTDKIELLNVLSSDYDLGSLIKVTADVNAYKNKAYFKLQEVV